uniref:Uncharacterized protein n=1 Tax=Magnetococcus massalia (strain MO-1) TaxID=451514 RepID=A0A1S7LMI6_MAGMO|nr:conserved protein of unknown function [Candidatus Magnetococcus massalia]
MNPLAADYIADKQRQFKWAVNHTNRTLQQWAGESPDVVPYLEPLSHLFANDWLRSTVHTRHLAEVAQVSSQPAYSHLVTLLSEGLESAPFAHRWLAQGVELPGESVAHQVTKQLLEQHNGKLAEATDALLGWWHKSGLERPPFKENVRQLNRDQKAHYSERLADEEKARLALVDSLPERYEHSGRFAKMGVIPRMACPQSCRHCMFVWRPPMKQLPDPAPFYRKMEKITKQLLFTGGDLTPVLDSFHQSIQQMNRINTFAILLNGTFAESEASTREVLRGFHQALSKRGKKATKAQVVLQISFDEFHQEIEADRHGVLQERIPVANIVNIIRALPDYPGVHLALLHKQNGLSFSQKLFDQGVVGRLRRALQQAGEALSVVQATPSSRPKQLPTNPTQSAPVIREALFTLARAPGKPIHFMSATTDAYGRAEWLHPSEYVHERALLDDYLTGKVEKLDDPFDIDPMIWLDGPVSLFSATHITMGHLFDEGWETVLARWKRDPLLHALATFDHQLLMIYGALCTDLQSIMANATSPHQLFHRITESAEVRLKMTQELIGKRS